MRLAAALLTLAAGTSSVAWGEGKQMTWGSTDWWFMPFWEGDTMRGESVFFIQETPEASPRAALLFPAKQILLVVQPHTGMVFEEGKDYLLGPDDAELTLPEGSRIPSRTRAGMYPEKDAPNSYPAKRDSDRYMLFGEGHFFQDLQVEVTYTHEPGLWEARGGYVPKPALSELRKTRAKLLKGEPITLALLGDSIATGANASGTVNSPPFMPPFGWLVAQHIRQAYGCPVTFKNFSVGGKSSGWGVETAPEVAKERPDLVILAFGMNDASGRVEKDQYIGNTKTEMEVIRQGNPDAEFVLVATMTGNPEWTYTSSEHYDQYREGLLGLDGDGVAVANMTSVWEELLRHKQFADITGNGVNHPNDFGHRCYAQVILGLLK